MPGTNEDQWTVHSTLELAEKLPKVKELIDDIKSGKREHGDGLWSKKPKPAPPPPKPVDPKVTKNRVSH